MKTYLLTIAVALACSMSTADTSAVTIVEDEQISRTLAEVREKFLKGKPFDRLDATILVKQPDGTWRRGSYNPEVINYPASCVKLPYMAAAMVWSRENGKPYTYLDAHVRPMIVVSDNVQTGFVVDAITSTTNIDDLTTDSDPRYAAWYDARLYTERFLQKRGLLENQVIVNKTYPTNSSESPAGAEKVARSIRGANRMQPKCSASLMLEIIEGKIEPEALPYMREILTHDRWAGASVLGSGLPPGSIYLNKPGNAYDTLEDIAYAKLPNGREIILAVFTNSFVRPYSLDPTRLNSHHLGPFTEMLIEKLDLTKGCPPKLVIDEAEAKLSGKWHEETTSSQHGNSYLVASGRDTTPSLSWNIKVPEPGKYEVSAWYPQDFSRTREAEYTVSSDDATTAVRVNQQKTGGRWYRIGDFNFGKAPAFISLSAGDTMSTTQTLAADAIRLEKWPE